MRAAPWSCPRGPEGGGQAGPARYAARPMYNVLFSQMKKQLGQLEKWLATAETFAQERKIDASVFPSFRLAPDQFPLSRQIQATCDTAKLAASRLTGKEAPANADTEQTLAELRARVTSTVAYLETLTEKDFAEADTRKITQPRWEGKWMTGADYFVEHAQPNFFFHLSHSYAILRHNGVPIGKRDYLGVMSQRPPES